MPDQKISQLTGGGAAQATDEIPIARSGSNFKLTGANIAAAATSVGTLSSLTVSGAASIQTLAASGQSLTGSQATSLVDLAATWNTTGTPTAIKLNVTDTASNAASLLMDLQRGGTSRMSVNKNGVITVTANVGAAFSSLSFGAVTASPANTAIWREGGVGSLVLRAHGQNLMWLYGDASNRIVAWPDAMGLWWTNGGPDSFGPTLALWRDADNIFAQRNTTNAQTFRLYNTFTDVSNYERTAITTAAFGGVRYQQILAESAGTGAANLGIVLAPKGTGAFTLQMPDGTTTGGNARGSNAVDLTSERSAATQVASGTQSFAVGRRVTASGSYATAIGDTNAATGTGSVALGSGNSATSSYAVAVGYSSTASGQYAFACNNSNTASGLGSFAQGESTAASGTYSMASALGGSASAQSAKAFGEFPAADKRGQFAIGFSRFSSNGDSQTSVMGLQGQTTAGAATEIFLCGISNTRMTVPASRTWLAHINVIARSTSGTDNAGFVRRCIIKRDASNNTALVGTVQTIGTDIGSNSGSPPAGWAVTVTADDTNESLKVEVTGAASTTINWVAMVQTVEVGLA